MDANFGCGCSFETIGTSAKVSVSTRSTRTDLEDKC